MGLVIMLSGCLLGFTLAAAGWLFAGLPLVVAILVWALSGPVSALLVVGWSMRSSGRSLDMPATAS